MDACHGHILSLPIQNFEDGSKINPLMCLYPSLVVLDRKDFWRDNYVLCTYPPWHKDGSMYAF